MIERILIKDYLSFEHVDISINKGLIAFTGASGAGKSIFMNAILTLFGLKDADAKLVEASVDLPMQNLEEFGIQNEDVNILRFSKEKKARYFINSQGLSKKNMSEVCKDFIRYLSLKDDDEFSSKNLLSLLDDLIARYEEIHEQRLDKFNILFKSYLKLKDELKKIAEEEKKINELKEFAKYEIKLIDDIDPKIGEDEELNKLKKSLSKKEKILTALQEANQIFEYENLVNNFLDLCEIDSSFFDESMNELRAILEDEVQKAEELDDVDIEAMLERIEQISKLKQRFGQIEDVLIYKEEKIKQLNHYENISFQKTNLQNECDDLEKNINTLAKDISKSRQKYIKKLENNMNEYLKQLYLEACEMTLNAVELGKNGVDKLEIKLGNTDIKKISAGELNRIRLALIATKNDIQSNHEGGILILDEVDANLSGKESMSVAKVLKQVSNSFQVLVISHQPQLPSLADEHFVVKKDDKKSEIIKLNKSQRVDELARMVSGDKVNVEAMEFAKKLLNYT